MRFSWIECDLLSLCGRKGNPSVVKRKEFDGKEKAGNGIDGNGWHSHKHEFDLVRSIWTLWDLTSFDGMHEQNSQCPYLLCSYTRAKGAGLE